MSIENSLLALAIFTGEMTPAPAGDEPASLLSQTPRAQFVQRRVKIKGNDMTAAKVNKHELKTKETRELLIKAAETIFVRDGYKGADLGEIAALAGRTKGAIYAQFKSKEDIFLALVEDHMLRNRKQMATLLEGSTSVKENIAEMRKFCLRLAEDESFGLLMLEFKLFCIRNPKSQKRLQKLFAGVLSKEREQQFSELLGQAGKGKDDVSRVVAVQTLQPIVSALILEAKLEPLIFGENTIKKVAGRMFDALFEVPKR
jgi:AcrR family transcriptional regulator